MWDHCSSAAGHKIVTILRTGQVLVTKEEATQRRRACQLPQSLEVGVLQMGDHTPINQRLDRASANRTAFPLPPRLQRLISASVSPLFVHLSICSTTGLGGIQVEG